MKKQGTVLVLVAVMAVLLCGAVSAADSSNTGGEELGEETTSDQAALIDPVLIISVNYKYADDIINPGIEVKDSNNAIVQYEKSTYPDFYKLNFIYPGVTNGTLFKVTVNAPGYTTQT